ncbi:scytonemin biosynthesis PEP-CTERM protein ScyF [Cyanothece sp. BG0011]|uniref:scytonemin biosynthesis PEP-CTERM protein ScyF n=1 Tax=Cyanothece sp. BG0011 TaxID=2082950 RepID=UPI0018E5305E|nr:scytonemin biosynthesis PEP-CTERM protein ScyF [Cyanothece sp. BG0011]
MIKIAKGLLVVLASVGFLEITSDEKVHALSLEFDRQIGTPGFGPGQLFVPQGIAVQPGTENVFVSNGRGLNPDGSFNPNLGNRIEVFSNDGMYLRSVGSGVSGSRGEGLDEPADIKFDPITGNVYVGDVFNSEIDVYNPNTGEFVTSFGSFSDQGPGDIFFGPGGMDFDAEGNLYVTDFSGDFVNIYNREGELVEVLGELGTELGQYNGPAGIAISQNTGNIYINDQFNNRIQVLDSDHNPLFAFGTEGTAPGQFNEPIGIDVDQFDNIYVADSQNNRIQVFDAQGNLLTIFGDPVAQPGPPMPGDLPFSTNPADLEPGVFNWTAGLTYVEGEIYVGISLRVEFKF